MKKALLFIATLLIGGNMLAQGLGLQLGYVSSKMKLVSEGEVHPLIDEEQINSKKGFLIGANYDIEIFDNLYVETGLNYQSAGFIQIYEGFNINGGDLVREFSLNYLVVPMKAKYNFEIGDDMYLFGFGGIDMGFVLSGNYKDNEDNSESLKIGNSRSDDFKGSDLDFSFGAGILYKGFELRMTLNSGLKDIDPDKDYEAYNRAFIISAGYRFDL